MRFVEENVRVTDSESRLAGGALLFSIRSAVALDLVVLFSLALFALWSGWLYRDFAQDDAFITYRYARNLANGYGFVYNRGQPVLGTTTPLCTLLLASLAYLTGHGIPSISHMLGVISLWIGGIVLYHLGKGRGHALAAVTALIFVSNPLLISSVGMETMFLIALMLVALNTYCMGKFYVTGFLLGLLFLTRLETVLFAGILAVHFLLQRRQLPYWLLVAAAVFLPWLWFAWDTFGSLVPNSAQAKILERMAGHGYSFAVGALIWWGVYIYETIWYVALLPVLLWGLVELRKTVARVDAYVLVLGWTAVYFLAASVLATSFPWYYGPLIPGFAILVSLGTTRLARVANFFVQGHKSEFGERARTGVFLTIALGMLILQVSTWNSYWVRHEGKIVDARYNGGKEVAAWLNAHGDSSQSVAVEEIGVLGYFTHMQIVDLYGLVTPILLPTLRHGRIETLNLAIALYDPEYVLARHPVHIEFLDTSAMYERVETFEDGTFVLYGQRAQDR